MRVDPEAKSKEQCAIKVLGERVPGSGSVRDIVVGSDTNYSFSSDVGSGLFGLNLTSRRDLNETETE
jgi:hypothetical protein